jgi:hypothetical protein
MSHRAEPLHNSADEQITTLIELLSTADDEALYRPCPGREKLGDGTIGAIAAHTTENYQRIAAFVSTSGNVSGRRGHGRHRRHRIPALFRARGHTPPDHSPAGRDGHLDGFTADGADPREIVERLAAARGELARIAELTDEQLDIVPPKDSFRFCDGERTLEQVLTGLLRHQEHQIQALQAALTLSP